MATSIQLTCGYMGDVHRNEEGHIATFKEAMQNVDYDTIAGTGLSGALMVPLFARALGKNWLLLRKPGEKSHAGTHPGEGRLGSRWIFLDDFVSSGTTRDNVIQSINRVAKDHRHTTECVGMYEYARSYHGFQRYSKSWDFKPSEPKKPRKKPKRDEKGRFATPTPPLSIANFLVQQQAASEMPLPKSIFGASDFFSFRY